MKQKAFHHLYGTWISAGADRRTGKRCGRKIIGNRAESGTKILEELGEQEIREGKLIVYTSADSVLQICGNEETMGLETLYHYCEIARELTMRDEWRVGRVIARPYVGKKKASLSEPVTAGIMR